MNTTKQQPTLTPRFAGVFSTNGDTTREKRMFLYATGDIVAYGGAFFMPLQPISPPAPAQVPGEPDPGTINVWKRLAAPTLEQIEAGRVTILNPENYEIMTLEILGRVAVSEDYGLGFKSMDGKKAGSFPVPKDDLPKMLAALILVPLD